MNARPVYLDWNATTPPAPEVRLLMARVAEEAWGNPASVHGAGRLARQHVESARLALAELTGADPRDVVLTSGGTEANNLALRSSFPTGQGTLLTSRIEHPSIVRVAEALEQRGVRVLWLPLNEAGVVREEELDRLLAESDPGSARLISVQAVNHEVGSIQPLASLCRIASRHGVPIHVDAVQAVGRIDSSVLRLPDLVTVASHKIRGPKGAGGLATRMAHKLTPLLLGGAQEKGLRPGTQDPVAMAGFAVALKRAAASQERYAQLAVLRDRLRDAVRKLIPIQDNTSESGTPHLLNLSFPGWTGPELCAALDLEGVHVSSGSACSAGTPDPSPVIEHLFGRQRARSAVRISLGEETDADDISRAISAFERVLCRTSGDR